MPGPALSRIRGTKRVCGDLPRLSFPIVPVDGAHQSGAARDARKHDDWLSTDTSAPLTLL